MNTYMLAALGADGWAAIIAATALAIVQIISAWRTSGKADATLKLAKDTHMLVNSAMGAQLTLHKIATERIAKLPDATEDEKKAAVTAKDLLSKHELQQAKVDHAL